MAHRKGVLDRLLIAICTREALLLLAVGLLAASIPVMLEQAIFVRAFWSAVPTEAQTDEIERIVDSLAGVLVAVGVFIESRAVIRGKVATGSESSELHERLDEVAELNGMGLLMVGLALEIGTAVVGMPTRFLDPRGIEQYVIAGCLLSNLLGAWILIDFIKDYLATYFGRLAD